MNAADYTFKNVVFMNAVSQPNDCPDNLIDGGAIRLMNSRLTLYNCTFITNRAYGKGGAVYVGANSHLETSLCNFSHNAGSRGGAIFAVNNTQIIVTSSTFSHNTAQENGWGGAICCDEILSQRSSYSNNHADRGGAIHATQGILNYVNFYNNNANARGGAFDSDTDEKMSVLNNVYCSGNSAKSGGAIGVQNGSVADSTFKNNFADEFGGAIDAWRLGMERCVFEDNRAEKRDGGAVRVTTLKDYKYNTRQYDLLNCKFINNHAGRDGGAIFTIASYEDGREGGQKLIANNYFDGNSAGRGSHHLHVQAHLVEEVKIQYNVFVNSPSGQISVITVPQGSDILNNWWGRNNPSTFYSNVAYAKGGAICTNKFEEDVKYASFVYNRAGHDNVESYGGGAIYIKDENWITFSQCFFGNNDCTGKGGAINLDSSSSHLTLINNIFMSNSANHEGQSVFNSGYYDKVNNNWWGNENPSSSNDQLVEWKFLPWQSNVHHSDSNPLRMVLELDKNFYVINETVTATLCFYKPDGSLFTGSIFDTKYDNQYLSFSLSPDVSAKNVIYNKNNVVMKLASPQEGTFKVIFTISAYDKQMSLSKEFSVIDLSISAPEIKDYYRNGQTLKIHLYGNKNLIANQKVTVSFINSVFEAYTDENGDASVFLSNLPLTPGRYSISVTAMESTVKTAVTVLSTINANDIVRVLGDYTPFYASFVDRQGQYLHEYTVFGYDIDDSPLIYFNVGKDGLASINIAFLGVGEHDIGLYNFETNEVAVYKITILARYDVIADDTRDNRTYQKNNSISQNNHENIDDGVVVFDNDDFNDSSNQSDSPVVKSIADNHSNKSVVKSIADNHPNDNNMYFTVGLLLLICLFGVIILKKYKN